MSATLERIEYAYAIASSSSAAVIWSPRSSSWLSSIPATKRSNSRSGLAHRLLYCELWIQRHCGLRQLCGIVGLARVTRFSYRHGYRSRNWNPVTPPKQLISCQDSYTAGVDIANFSVDNLRCNSNCLTLCAYDSCRNLWSIDHPY